MSLIILNDWFINEDRSIIYYDTNRVAELSTGNKKSVVPASSLAAVAGTDIEPKSVVMHEHRVQFQPGKHQVFESVQFEGYQVSYRQGKNYYTFAMPRGRRLQTAPPTTAVPAVAEVATPQTKKSEKKQKVVTFAQSQDEVEILLGLKEAPPPEPVVETTETTETTETAEPAVQVVELQEVVSQ
jgi:hypothetical protein